MRIRGYWSRYAFYEPQDVLVWNDAPYIVLTPVQGLTPNESEAFQPFDPKREYPLYQKAYEPLPEQIVENVIYGCTPGKCAPLTYIGEKDGVKIVDVAKLGMEVCGFAPYQIMEGRTGPMVIRGLLKAEDWLRGGVLDSEYLESGNVYYLSDRFNCLTLEDTGKPLVKALSTTEAETI